MALGFLTGVVSGALKLLGDTKKSGAKMAASITNRKPQKGAIVKKEVITPVKEKRIRVQKLMNIEPPDQLNQSKESSGVKSIDSVLDRIDNTLFNLIQVVGDSSKLQQNQIRKDVVTTSRKKKKTREEMLENTKRFIGRLGSKVPKPVKNIWDKLKTFFGSIAVGSLVLFILQSWNTIVKTIENVVEKIKELFVKLEPILTPIWNFTKWMVVKSVELTARLVGVEDADKNTLLKNIGEITKKALQLFGLFEGVEKLANDLKGGKKIDTKTNVEESHATMDGDTSSIMHSEPPPAAQEVRISKGSESSSVGGLGVNDGDLIAMADTSQQPISPQAVYNYLRSKGVSDTHAEGMVANIAAESSFRPWILGDNGTSGGLFQHHASRFSAMKSFVGKDWRENWKGQIDYALSEGDTKKYLGIQFKTSADASRWFTLNWERPADAKTKAEERIQKHLRNFELDSHLPYEINQGTTNVFVSKRVVSPAVGGEGRVQILPIPLLNTSGEVMTETFMEGLRMGGIG